MRRRRRKRRWSEDLSRDARSTVCSDKGIFQAAGEPRLLSSTECLRKTAGPPWLADRLPDIPQVGLLPVQTVRAFCACYYMASIVLCPTLFGGERDVTA